MSLKVEDWKKVLDQPKNLGLKAGGGTGISKALEAYGKAAGKFNPQGDLDDNVDHAREAEKAAKDLKALCDSTVAKHKALFTTACDYLKQVSKEAEAAEKLFAFRLKRGTEQQAQIKKAKDAKQALALYCHDQGYGAVDGCTTLDQLETVWQKFSADLKKKIDDYEESVKLRDDGLDKHGIEVRVNKPKEDAAALQKKGNGPAAAFALVKTDYRKTAEALFHYTTKLRTDPPFGWS